MHKIKLFSVFVLLALLLSVGPGAVVAQEPPPGGPIIRAIEDVIFVPKDTDAYDYADNVRNASDHGCNDYWAIFYSSYPNLPGGVWGDNGYNQLHIDSHPSPPGPGLDGYFRCNPGGSCTTYLCTKHGWYVWPPGHADAWTVKVSW